jgi:glycosyltransferase involved in cell wall biosynthesis
VDAAQFRNDPERREHARALLGLPEAVTVVGTVGRLHPDKNQALLLHAAALLRDEIRGIRVAVIGDGPERPRLEALSHDLRIDEHVKFLGERSDVEKLLPGLDVFALTSVTEGTPVTLLEAMAAGIPIVSTAVGGIPEILADGVDALLLPAPIERADPSLSSPFARLLAAPLRDPELARRLAASARGRVEREFSLESSFGRYEDLYRALLKNGSFE